VLATLCFALACANAPAPGDGGGRPDTGFCCGRDASVLPPSDAGHDAFSWPDTGPQPDPVLPAQSWTMHVRAGDAFDLTVALDARAESGWVRAVAGAGGRSTALVLDVLPDGVLRPRAPILLGMPGVHQCSYDTIAITELRLHFTDLDGDGVREALTGASSDGAVTLSGPGVSPMDASEMFVASAFARDETPPAVSVLQADFLPGAEPLVLVASEPIAPTFMPTLTGARTVVITPEVGATAAARWTVETSTLTPGHYALTQMPVQDLAGHASVVALPTLAFDVPPPAPLDIDGIDNRVRSVVSSEPTAIIGDDPGETPIEGATSLLLGGRSAIWFDVLTAGGGTLQIAMRVVGPAGRVTSAFRIFDADGQHAGDALSSSDLAPPAMIPGREAQGGLQLVNVPFVAPRAGRFRVMVEAAGTDDERCGAGAPAAAGIYGMIVDSVFLLSEP
jgi:hypothetical protein